MPGRLQFSRTSMVTRLIMLNLIILFAIGGVGVANLLFSRRVGETLNTVIDRDVTRVIANAALSRNLNTVFAETHLLLNTFIEQDQVLAVDGERLIAVVRSSLAARAPNDDVYTTLTNFQQTLAVLFDQCAVILQASQQIQATEQKLETAIDELDGMVMDLVLARTMEGKAYELSAFEQVSAAVPDYRSLLLQIAMQLANERRNYNGADVAGSPYAQRIADLLGDLTTGLLAVTTAGDELTAPGKHLLATAQTYQEHILGFHAAMAIFQDRVADLNQAQSQVMTVLAEIEADIADATGSIRATIDRDIQLSRTVTALFSVIIVVVLGGTGLYAINLTRPILHLTTSAVAIAEGNLDTPITISGADEIGTLARSFVHMREAVREKIAALAENNAALHQEILERQRAEEALRASEERFRSIFSQSPLAIELYDQHGVLLDFNAHCLDLFGLSNVEAIKGFRLFDDPNIPETGKALLKTGKPVRYEAPFDFNLVKAQQLYATTKSGQSILECFITPWGKAAGDIQGFLVHIIDITERRRAEEHIKNENVRLEQAVQEKQREMKALFERLIRQEKLATIGQMAGSIAHELRNPLGAAKNSIFYLKRLQHTQMLDAANPKVAEHLDLIDHELNLSERVIADLLNMTRVRTVQRVEAELRPILTEAVKRCHLPEQIRLQLDLPPDPCHVWSDTGQLRQVLINLLTNAAQAIGQEGVITIRAACSPEERMTVIEIADTGCGIADDALAKVFEPLYTTKAAGTGLGLSICKQVIENHQGRITIQSQVGQGTTVTLRLPNDPPAE